MAFRSISGKRVLVTGASSGIGREIARHLARAGASLVITARREERLRELATEFENTRKSPDQKCVIVPGDITDPKLRDQLVEACEHQLGGMDILINNAGVGAIGVFATADPSRLRKIMEVNFFAPAELIRRSLPLLLKGNKPQIVNVASVLGHRAVPKKSEYSASKFALHGLSDSLRAELAGKIDVTIVSPSTTKSEFFDNVLEKKADLPWLSLGGQSSAGVARATMHAIRWGRHEVILTLGGKLLVWADRWCPPFVNRMVALFG